MSSMIRDTIKKICEQYEIPLHERMSHILIGSGSYRQYDKSRINILVLSNSNPLLVIKFYKFSNELMENEFNLQKKMYEIYLQNGISRPIGLTEIDDRKFLVEQGINGKSLDRLLSDHPDETKIEHMFERLMHFYNYLNSKSIPSSFESLKAEVDSLHQKFIAIYNPNQKEADLIKELLSHTLQYLKNQQTSKRYSNGDFIPKNLFLNEDQITMIDFEFAENTHLHFLEWFRFFKNQQKVPNEYLYKLLHSKITDQYFTLALQEYSNFHSQNVLGIGLRLLFEIKDHVLRFSVISKALLNTERSALRELLDQLSRNYNEINQNKKSDTNQNLSNYTYLPYRVLYQKIKGDDDYTTLTSELENNPMGALLFVYSSRDDLCRVFPEAAKGELKNLLNWAINTEVSKIGDSTEIALITRHKKFYEEELQKLNEIDVISKQKREQESKISNLLEEKQQQEELLAKTTAEKQQQEELVQKESTARKELQSYLDIAHRAVQEKENERTKLTEELSTIKNSISWKLFLKVQHMLSSVFPHNTRRGAFLYLVLQFMRFSSAYGVKRSTKMTLDFFKQKGTRFLDQPIQSKTQLKNWKEFQNFNEIEISNMKKEIANFKLKPKISIVMPVYNIDEKWLRLAIDSVRGQIYENWELCIADDASTASHIRSVLQEYANKDKRIKIKFLEKNQNIAGASNEALSMVTGHYVGLLDHDDEIYQDALYEVVKSINNNPNLEIIYSDENHISPEGERIDPFFKPDYSPDLLMTCHYMVHFMVYKASLLHELGGFRRGFDGSQDYDLVLRAVEKTSQIHHIPRLLYGWRNIATSTASGGNVKPYAQVAAKKALEEALERRKIDGAPEYLPELGYFKINYNLTKKPLVSIIITTRDRPDLLSRLLSSIEKKTTYDNYEIIVVDHLSEKKEALELYKSLKHKVIRYEKEFNIPNLFNFAEKYANGEYLLTMNDDLEVIAENWIESMLGPCQREEVGIVGAQLIYPDASAHTGLIAGQTIQHAGVVLGVGGIAGHAFRHINHLYNGYFGFNKTLRNYSAVTGSCMLVKRDVYKKVNGYDPALKVAYNDVDFCLRVRKEGYLIVYTPYAKLYHYEGASRGTRQPSDDAKTFVNRWKDVLMKRDPYYNVNLTLLREDFSLSSSGIPIRETPLALLVEIYANRPDLQKAFPEVVLGQYENLITWAATYGSSGQKFGLPNDQHSNILSTYQFWYEENSRKESKMVEQKIA